MRPVEANEITVPSLATAVCASPSGAPASVPSEVQELARIERATALGLDPYWDEQQGGWDHGQKVPLWMTNERALARSRAGDAKTKKRVLFTLAQQLGIVDPVWGGIYQYSLEGDSRHPHYEKLMTYNAGALANYAEAYALTKARARRPARRHPRVRARERARDTCILQNFRGDRRRRGAARAKKATDAVLATHALASGGLTHDGRGAVMHLSDNAAMAFALLGLGGASKAPARVLELGEDRVDDNVTMLRVLARLARALPDRAPRYRRAIDRTLRAVATPERIRARGRTIGDFLMALEETEGVR